MSAPKERVVKRRRNESPVCFAERATDLAISLHGDAASVEFPAGLLCRTCAPFSGDETATAVTVGWFGFSCYNCADTRVEEQAVTETSLQVFLAYAQDAGNWGGMPLVGGNVGGGQEERGNLTQLKRAGLITTQRDGADVWVSFTDAGRALAAKHGVTL